jgi:hypothetical protein
MAGGSSNRCDSDAVLVQIAVAVRAIEAELAADPNPDREQAAWRAFWVAKQVAFRGTPPDVAHLADLFVGWLVERTRDGGSLVVALPIALEAAEHPHGDSPLARDLLEFVTGFCDGSMSGEEWGRRLKKPRGTGRGRHPVKRALVPAGTITISAAESMLRDMLGPRSDEGDAIDARAAWDAFKSFAKKAVAADPPEHLQSDDLLFEWGGGTMDFTRQFTIEDSDGDYDRMEQLHLTCSIETTGARLEAIWGAHDELDSWIAQVEQTAAFRLLADGMIAARFVIEQERI